MVEEEVEVDVEIKSTADKLYMFVTRSQHVSKSTRYVQGCDLLEGEWGKVGSTLLWKLTFDGEPRVSKDRTEVIDVENNVTQWTVLEGPLKKEYWSLKYERIDEKVVHLEKLLKFFVEVMTEVDQYLLSED